MEEALVQQLQDRNRTIIDAVIAKAERDCPGSVALIALTGSFQSGDFYEKSDLDLFIVINDADGWKIATRFILEDVAHDIFCYTWAQVEEMASYPTPHVDKLLHVEILYSQNEETLARYYGLRTRLQETLARPLTLDDLRVVQAHFDSAKRAYAEMILVDDFAWSKCLSTKVLVSIEYVVYMLNKRVIEHGVRYITDEIEGFPILPQAFMEHYFIAINADTKRALQRDFASLLNTTGALLQQTTERLSPPKPLTADVLRGSYEEIWSNWGNKMHLAASTGDRYLALTTMANCQDFYNEMASTHGIEVLDLFDGFKLDDLDAAATRFDMILEKYGEHYARLGIPVLRYASLAEFTSDYLA